jgi:hypothetical protein
MAQFNTNQIIYCGDHKQYYNYNEELYTATFPQEWASSHAPMSGPKECDNCRNYGSWNGVFIGYCINCANDPIYEGKRGRGMMSYGIELYATKQSKNISMYDSYFKDADLEKIGDLWIDDTYHRVYSSVSNIPIHKTFDEWLSGSMVFNHEKRGLCERPEQIITLAQKMEAIADAITPSCYKTEKGKEYEEYIKDIEENGMDDEVDDPTHCMNCDLDGYETYICEYHRHYCKPITRRLQIVRHDGHRILKCMVYYDKPDTSIVFERSIDYLY